MDDYRQKIIDEWILDVETSNRLTINYLSGDFDNDHLLDLVEFMMKNIKVEITIKR
jgi:hypothetical protein